MGPRLRPPNAECGPIRWSPSLVVSVEPEDEEVRLLDSAGGL
jgi:hypothetical protein